MNKYFEMARVTGGISLVTAIMSSAVYLGFKSTTASSLQYLNGKEELVDIVFHSHLSELRLAYTLAGVTIFCLGIMLVFGYKGFRASK